MGRHGGPRPGVRFLVFSLALPALLWTTSCGGADGAGRGAGGSGGPGHSARGPAAASASPASDAELCARIVAHWSRKVLDSGTYGDYQSMGLSNGQYEILRDVVDAARAAERRQGAAAADELIGRQAHESCAERYRHGTPSGGPWR
ncbi:hypothetical protein [Streptomyces sp. NPDC101165]|uniref:hypothetical protein n=1 Tax=Streptomyces sp. NPDC101165 TaxID=3366119 RepID=UPI0037F8A95C